MKINDHNTDIFHFEYLTYVLKLNLQVVVETMSLIVFYGTIVFVAMMLMMTVIMVTMMMTMMMTL